MHTPARNGIFLNDDSALKPLFWANRAAIKNRQAIYPGQPALQSLKIMFGAERVPLVTP